MILKSARIKNYKCIFDSEEFTVGRLTCLVGKNEAGKTAILQALYKLNPVVASDGKFDELEYPRTQWAEYTERHQDHPDTVIYTKWEIQEFELEALAKRLGPNGLKANEVAVSKGYDNKTYWTVPINEPEVVRHLLKEEGVSSEEAPQCHKAKTIPQLTEALRDADTPSKQSLLARLNTDFPGGSAFRAAVGLLTLPKFVYFDSYYRLSGQVSMNQIVQRRQADQMTDADRVFLALLDLAGTSLEDIQKIGMFERLVAKLEAVSNRITREIFEYWSQNRHLKVDFRFDAARHQDPPPFNEGYIFRTRIENTRHGVTVSFDERSAGFVWFFSFLIWFSQVRKNYGENVVILLDEPGLNLHAKAQADLLRYFHERLAGKYQTVYTTHSPFMVNVDDLDEIKTVEDVTGPGDKVQGTKVGDRILSTDADTVFPLQAALGYDLTQSLFIGKHTLLVEGPSDLLYIKWFSRELINQGRHGLDPRWVVTPSGGIDKVASFVALFGGNRLHVAVLTDFHHGDKKKVKELRESKLLKQGHVLTADMYVDKSEADIEDILGRDFYIALVNKCYSLKPETCVPTQASKETPLPIVREVESHFATLPLGAPEFDHYAPSVFLLENGADLRRELPGLSEALDRFEKLFQNLNSMLPRRG